MSFGGFFPASMHFMQRGGSAPEQKNPMQHSSPRRRVGSQTSFAFARHEARQSAFSLHAALQQSAAVVQSASFGFFGGRHAGSGGASVAASALGSSPDELLDGGVSVDVLPEGVGEPESVDCGVVSFATLSSRSGSSR